jgi:hypothetical protein
MPFIFPLSLSQIYVSEIGVGGPSYYSVCEKLCNHFNKIPQMYLYRLSFIIYVMKKCNLLVLIYVKFRYFDLSQYQKPNK